MCTVDSTLELRPRMCFAKLSICSRPRASRSRLSKTRSYVASSSYAKPMTLMPRTNCSLVRPWTCWSQPHRLRKLIQHRATELPRDGSDVTMRLLNVSIISRVDSGISWALPPHRPPRLSYACFADIEQSPMSGDGVFDMG